jgi:hypothetical protein
MPATRRIILHYISIPQTFLSTPAQSMAAVTLGVPTKAERLTTNKNKSIFMSSLFKARAQSGTG